MTRSLLVLRWPAAKSTALICGLATLLVVLSLRAGDALAAAGPPAPPAASPVPEAYVAPKPKPPVILAPVLLPAPASGKGRLALVIAGNRRWCTYPDDRLVRPPERAGEMQRRKKKEVFTFGYQFIISAVKRGQPDTPLMLFESPVFRTATWLPASKTGEYKQTGPKAPIIVSEGTSRPQSMQPPTGPSTLVPFWQELARCVTLPERMDFDLAPGTYDVYVAFDMLNRDGGWVHRSTGYLTDIPIEEARRTRLDGLINLAGATNRQVELQSSTLEPDVIPMPGAPDP